MPANKPRFPAGTLTLVRVTVKFQDGKKWTYSLPAVPRLNEIIHADRNRYIVREVAWNCENDDVYDASRAHVQVSVQPVGDSFIQE